MHELCVIVVCIFNLYANYFDIALFFRNNYLLIYKMCTFYLSHERVAVGVLIGGFVYKNDRDEEYAQSRTTSAGGTFSPS